VLFDVFSGRSGHGPDGLSASGQEDQLRPVIARIVPKLGVACPDEFLHGLGHRLPPYPPQPG
jgi:hypothetical protein